MESITASFGHPPGVGARVEIRVKKVNMKSRSYTSPLRTRKAEATAERILRAALARLSTEYYEDVTLEAIASDADVTVQTVLRRFGSKEGLVRALVEFEKPGVTAQRDEAPVGDVARAVANVVDHYEAIGDLVMLLLRQEERVLPFAEATAFGKKYHAGWVDRVFAPWLEERTGDERHRLNSQLVATCDTYMWYLLRRQQGLSRAQAELALVEILTGILTSPPAAQPSSGPSHPGSDG
jgi:AcrR family transcriptional regulator